MVNIVVLDSFAADQGETNLWDALKSVGNVEIFNDTSAAEFIARAKDFEVIVTNKVNVDKAAMEALPNLKMVAVTATGFNNVDLSYAKERDIVVCNVPAYSTDSVAQLTIAYILDYAIGVREHNKQVQEGKWSGCFCFFTQKIVELASKKLAIVGMGNIGSKVKQIAEAMGMEVINAAIPGRPLKDGKVELKQAVADADFVSFNCPLSEQTKELANKELFDACKDGAVILNLARGGVVKDKDLHLLDAVNSGKIARAYLDVLVDEPPKKDNLLVGHKDIIVTPHIAWGSFEARKRLIDTTIENIKCFAQGKPQNRVA